MNSSDNSMVSKGHGGWSFITTLSVEKLTVGS